MAELAACLLLDTWWGLLVSVAAASLIVVRTVLEDRLLHRDLAGYPDYAGKVRFRLVPGVW